MYPRNYKMLEESLNLECKILIVGCGGIACELVKLLWMYGNKNITLIDYDTISLSNLNRQFIFKKTDIGSFKSQKMAEKYIKKLLTKFSQFQKGKNTESTKQGYRKSEIIAENSIDFGFSEQKKHDYDLRKESVQCVKYRKIKDQNDFITHLISEEQTKNRENERKLKDSSKIFNPGFDSERTEQNSVTPTRFLNKHVKSPNNVLKQVNYSSSQNFEKSFQVQQPQNTELRFLNMDYKENDNCALNSVKKTACFKNDNLMIDFIVDDIKSFDITFFHKFDIIFNCLDNVEARKYVNLMVQILWKSSNYRLSFDLKDLKTSKKCNEDDSLYSGLKDRIDGHTDISESHQYCKNVFHALQNNFEKYINQKSGFRVYPLEKKLKKVIFVDGGSTGFLGQSWQFDYENECYECSYTPSQQETTPICTIRTKPKIFEHCIAWTQSVFFDNLNVLKKILQDDPKDYFRKDSNDRQFFNSLESITKRLGKKVYEQALDPKIVYSYENTRSDVKNSTSDIGNQNKYTCLENTPSKSDSIMKIESLEFKNQIANSDDLVRIKTNSDSRIQIRINELKNEPPNLQNLAKLKVSKDKNIEIQALESNDKTTNSNFLASVKSGFMEKQIEYDLNDKKDFDLSAKNQEVTVNGENNCKLTIKKDFCGNVLYLADSHRSSENFFGLGLVPHQIVNASPCKRIKRDENSEFDDKSFLVSTNNANTGQIFETYLNVNLENKGYLTITFRGNNECCENSDKYLNFLYDKLFSQYLDLEIILISLMIGIVRMIIYPSNLEKIEIPVRDFEDLYLCILKHLIRDSQLFLDKDDQMSLDIMYLASKIRSNAFNIPFKDKMTSETISARIVPAVCTTNSIIASLMYLTAQRSFQNGIKNNYFISKSNKIVQKTSLIKQNENCPVCTKDYFVIALTQDSSEKITILSLHSMVQEITDAKFNLKDCYFVKGNEVLFDGMYTQDGNKRVKISNNDLIHFICNAVSIYLYFLIQKNYK